MLTNNTTSVASNACEIKIQYARAITSKSMPILQRKKLLVQSTRQTLLHSCSKFLYTVGMDKFLLPIDQYMNEETPDFSQFYNWFQDAYFGDQNRNARNHLQRDEIDFLDTVNDLLAYASADPTPEEQNDGIVDQYEFQQQLKDLKARNASLWKRYGVH